VKLAKPSHTPATCDQSPYIGGSILSLRIAYTEDE